MRMHGEEFVEHPRGTRASAFISHAMLVKTCAEHRPSPPAKVERNQVNTAINYSFPIMLSKDTNGSLRPGSDPPFAFSCFTGFCEYCANVNQ